MIIFIDDSAAAPAFPQVLSVTSTLFGASTINHAANYPATTAAGDLLLYFVMGRQTSGTVTVTTPSGLNFIALRNSGGASTSRAFLYSRIADGTEGGGTVNFATGVAAHMAVQIWRIDASSFSGSVLSITNEGVSTTNPDTDNVVVSPAGDVLAISWFGSNGTASPLIYAYPDNQTTAASGGTLPCRVISSSTTVSGASGVNPGPYTMAALTNFAGFTVAIRSA